MSNPFEPPQSPQTPLKSRPLLWMALIFAVLFLLGLVAFQAIRLQQQTAMMNEVRAQERMIRQQAVDQAQQAVEQARQAAESAEVHRQQDTPQ